MQTKLCAKGPKIQLKPLKLERVNLPRTKIGSAIASDEWIEGNMRLHNLKSTGSLVRKLPSDFRRELSKLNKVEVPHPGASYNPSYSDHQVS